MDGHTRAGVSRRGVLAGVALGSVSLAGCLGGDGSAPPEARTLTQSDSCDVCGMVIPNHPGPSTQIYYPGEEPGGHENPARFDSTWEAYQFHFERSWDAAAFYVTDYSGVDYAVFEEGGDTLLSTHPEASAFVDAETVTYVVGSEVKGAMGTDLVGFGDRNDAEAFRSKYGGDLLEHGDVTEGTIAGLGN